ncbi:hypothetical protein FHW58_003395 [Duganella sp. 1224]|uniref:DUF6527 family protein n=1 Tax=Duganella sp. 1224 TaxID=2587052 RepID=UPI0015CBE045|nr:DUF6527 family protein [Duganella sp. 1224]NYE62180.1 hypothetical protein [Duganella sp. 1224]
MSTIGRKLDDFGDNQVAFNCPGCGEIHVLAIGPSAAGTPRPVWGFNGNGDAPTFTPSVLSRAGHYIDGDTKECWCTYEARFGRPSPFKCCVCHSFVTDGQIQFLSDCTHALAGKTVPLPDWTKL